MQTIFGFDIGVTSIGFAALRYDPATDQGEILKLGVRIFPETREPKGAPLNQDRRLKRMTRRQLRRRRERRRLLNETLTAAGLLPTFTSCEWAKVMKEDPILIRERGLTERLEPHQLGRALYHLAKRRHFKERELEESTSEETKEEKEATTNREKSMQALERSGKTIGGFLSDLPRGERRRGMHFVRSAVHQEFKALMKAQSAHHKALTDALKANIEEVIFAQKPVFWRMSTLGECAYIPGEPLSAKGSWLSQQRRMLEKLNTLSISGGNERPLDGEERAAVLKKLQSSASVSWAELRRALQPIFKARGENGGEKKLKFNLELGGDKGLPGNLVEKKLAEIFGEEWEAHPQKQKLRDAAPARIWAADYQEIGSHRLTSRRVVIRSEAERRARRAEAAAAFTRDFDVSRSQAKALSELTFPSGWEPYSTKALGVFLPRLEAGARFGALTNSPLWEEWRRENFPNRRGPTGEVLALLPSPSRKTEASQAEQKRLSSLRNPTVIRVQNELRKIVNNLIRTPEIGRPDMIRIELARDVGASQKQRQEIQDSQRKQERRRIEATKDLKTNGIAEPSRRDVEKWLLWQETKCTCPYTGDKICFKDLFVTNKFDIEHIWPRALCLDDGMRNKTLCRKDANLEKGSLTPFEYLGSRPDAWENFKTRLKSLAADKGSIGLPPGKVKRLLAESIPDDFAARQLVETGFAAREAMAQLKRLWPDDGRVPPVQAVSGRVTAQLRKLWGLNNVLSDSGEKTREDHRHHAIDALVVACADLGVTQRLSRYWRDRDNPAVREPFLPRPWANIRADAEEAVKQIIVSHRVRKKISGPLHKGTAYGDTKEDYVSGGVRYRGIVERTPIVDLTAADLAGEDLSKHKTLIRDETVRNILRRHLDDHGGELKDAMAAPPTVSPDGPPIRKVRLVRKRQLKGLIYAHNGLMDPEAKHHLAIYREPDGGVQYEIVSLLEAARRVSKRLPLVTKTSEAGGRLIMTLSKGDMLKLDYPGSVYWVVREIKATGRVTLVPHFEARATKKGMSYEPTAPGLLAFNPTKVSVDPIGRVRPAND